MHVTAVDVQVLTGDMASFRGDQKDDKGGHFRGNNRIYAYPVGQKLHGPFTCQGEDRAFRRYIAGSPSLARDRGLRANADDGSTGALQMWQSIVRHMIVMQQIALERRDELFRSAFFQSDAIIYTGVVHQRIDSTKFLQGLLDGAGTGPRSRKFRDGYVADAPALSQVRMQFFCRLLIAVHDYRNRAFFGNRLYYGSANAFGASRNEYDFVLQLQVHETSTLRPRMRGPRLRESWVPSLSRKTEKCGTIVFIEKGSSAEVQPTSVDRIIHSSDERGFLRAQEKSQRGNFVRLSHPADGLCSGELCEHFIFLAWVIALQVAVDERRVDSRRRDAIATDLVLKIVLGYRKRHRNHGTFAHRVSKTVSQRRRARDRRHVQNHTTTVLFHMPNARLHAVEEPFYVDLEEFVEVALGCRFQAANMRNSSVVDKDVDGFFPK